MQNRLSVAFEQQISRIYRLLESEGSIIKWNDTIYGEADSGTPRQVDVTIRRGDALIHVECRLRNRPQDVEWIEQLIGRRVTLNADLMIGVSASGFTKGARQTALRNGIIIRDLLTLTEEEILQWGKRVTAFLGYFVYKDISIFIVFDRLMEKKIDTSDVLDVLRENDLFHSILNNNKKVLDKQPWEEGKARDFLLEYLPKSLAVKNYPIRSIYFLSKVKYHREIVSVRSVQVFGAPEVPAGQRDVYVQCMDLNGLEISKHNKFTYIMLDLSSIIPPHNAQFRDVVFDLVESGVLKGFELYGHRLPPISLQAVMVQALFGNPEAILQRLINQHPELKKMETNK